MLVSPFSSSGSGLLSTTLLEKHFDPAKAWKAIIKESGKKNIAYLLDSLIQGANWSRDQKSISFIDKGIEIFGKKSLNSKAKEKLEELKQIRKIIGETKETKVLKEILKPKDPKEQVKLLEAAVKKAPWDKNEGQRKAIDKAQKKLNEKPLKSNVKKKLDTVKALDDGIQKINAQTLPKEQKPAVYTPLFTARITKSATCKNLRAICKVWNENAKFKADIATATATHAIKKEKQKIAVQSSKMVANFTDIDSLDIEKLDALYIAYDSNKKLQAIASVEFSKHKSQELTCLASNPDNIVVLGDEKTAVRGAGSALITHIVHDILKDDKYKKKQLKLTALSSAEAFYKKLGFQEKKDGDYVLTDDKMKALLQQKPATHHIEAHEPSSQLLI